MELKAVEVHVEGLTSVDNGKPMAAALHLKGSICLVCTVAYHGSWWDLVNREVKEIFPVKRLRWFTTGPIKSRH